MAKATLTQRVEHLEGCQVETDEKLDKIINEFSELKLWMNNGHSEHVGRIAAQEFRKLRDEERDEERKEREEQFKREMEERRIKIEEQKIENAKIGKMKDLRQGLMIASIPIIMFLLDKFFGG